MKKLILFLFLPMMVFAAVSPDHQTQSLLTDFQTASANWRAAFVPAAKYVFFSLVLMDWVIEFGLMAIKGTDIPEIFAVAIRKTLIIGLFMMLIANSSWLSSIPSSLSQLGNSAGGTAVDVDSVLNYGIDIVNDIWKGISLFSPGDSMALIFTGIILIIAFALMSAQLFITTVKMYALLAVAPLVFSLGGLGQTRQMAYNPIFAILKVGFELLFLKLFMGMTINEMQQFAANVDTDNGSILTMIALSILMVSVVHMIPGMVEAVLNGTLGANSTAGLGTASAVMGGAVAGAAGAMGGVAAVREASKLASEQRAGGDSSASTFKNLKSAFKDDVKRSMAGENLGGTMGSRMAFRHSTDGGLRGQTNDINKAQTAVNDTKSNQQSANEDQALAGQNK